MKVLEIVCISAMILAGAYVLFELLPSLRKPTGQARPMRARGQQG